jgi:hypothetical protein
VTCSPLGGAITGSGSTIYPDGAGDGGKPVGGIRRGIISYAAIIILRAYSGYISGYRYRMPKTKRTKTGKPAPQPTPTVPEPTGPFIVDFK